MLDRGVTEWNLDINDRFPARDQANPPARTTRVESTLKGGHAREQETQTLGLTPASVNTR